MERTCLFKRMVLDPFTERAIIHPLPTLSSSVPYERFALAEGDDALQLQV